MRVLIGAKNIMCLVVCLLDIGDGSNLFTVNGEFLAVLWLLQIIKSTINLLYSASKARFQTLWRMRLYLQVEDKYTSTISTAVNKQAIDVLSDTTFIDEYIFSIVPKERIVPV